MARAGYEYSGIGTEMGASSKWLDQGEHRCSNGPELEQSWIGSSGKKQQWESSDHLGMSKELLQ